MIEYSPRNHVSKNSLPHYCLNSFEIRRSKRTLRASGAALGFIMQPDIMRTAVTHANERSASKQRTALTDGAQKSKVTIPLPEQAHFHKSICSKSLPEAVMQVVKPSKAKPTTKSKTKSP